MSADDRKDPRDEQQSDPVVPVEDLQPKPVDDRAADAVTGGEGHIELHDYGFAKSINKSSP